MSRLNVEVDTLSRPLTTTQRYWKNDALTQRVKLLLNNCGVRESEERFRELANLVDKWENGEGPEPPNVENGKCDICNFLYY